MQLNFCMGVASSISANILKTQRFLPGRDPSILGTDSPRTRTNTDRQRPFPELSQYYVSNGKVNRNAARVPT